MKFGVKLWGVRGSIACPTADHIAYGGNTSCIEVIVGAESIVLDAGTGLRELGLKFGREKVTSAPLLLTHTHWDHICGFPFFAPFFSEESHFKVMSGHLTKSGGVRSALAGQMARPMFPVPLDALTASVEYIDFDEGAKFDLLDGKVSVTTAPLNHPDGATGYRLSYKNSSVCYVTDTEHIPGRPDENILELIEGADLVIYDCTYTDDEFPKHKGWGHSTWQEGVRLCQEAGAKKLAIFHHDPAHDDAFMGQVEKDAAEVWDHTVVAREGMVIELI